MAQRAFNTIISSVVETHTTPQEIFNLFVTQVALHGKNKFNLILDMGNKGLYYTTKDNLTDIKDYMKKYHKKGWINTRGSSFDKYYKRIYMNYVNKIERDCYLIYVKADGINRGENKIMGVNDEMKEILNQQVDRINNDADIQLQILLSRLGLKL